MSHKLLLADDSLTIQRVVELTFADEDVQVLRVSNGEQAIARVQSDRPNIVLADIGLPERTGYEVSARIKQDTALAHIPVLLLRGALDPIDEELLRQAQCDGVLVKPLEPQRLIERVRELLGGRSLSTTAAENATSDVGPAIERPTASPPAPPSPEPSLPPNGLDDYFDHLDAAFAARAASLDIPLRLEELPEATNLPDTFAEAPAAVPASTIADAFSALLAAEQGGAGATPFTLTVGSAPAIDDAMIDTLARRVAERLGPDAVREVVADVVSQVAERLIREEIERIRKATTETVTGASNQPS